MAPHPATIRQTIRQVTTPQTQSSCSLQDPLRSQRIHNHHVLMMVLLRMSPTQICWIFRKCTSLQASQKATKVQRMLGIRVFKLKKIHEEVERLKHKQDAKNGIMSLNNELKLLSAKLADFEEKAGNSQRLLNKKANSSTLLEEERFRKQMQGTFAAKLETLRQMLNEWEAKEGQIEDDDMLSEVVKSMLQNSHRIDAWMNEKTRLMHLRTTKTKSRHRATPMSDRTSSSIRPSSGSLRSRSSTISSQHGIPHSSKRLSPVPSSDGTQVDNKSSRSSRSTIASHRARPAKSPTRKKITTPKVRWYLIRTPIHNCKSSCEANKITTTKVG